MGKGKELSGEKKKRFTLPPYDAFPENCARKKINKQSNVPFTRVFLLSVYATNGIVDETLNSFSFFFLNSNSKKKKNDNKSRFFARRDGQRLYDFEYRHFICVVNRYKQFRGFCMLLKVLFLSLRGCLKNV